MRRAPAEVRKIEPDPVYRSVLVSQVINKVLWRGKKGAARVIEDPLGGRGLPSINVGHDPDIADSLEGDGACHYSVTSDSERKPCWTPPSCGRLPGA